MSVLRQANILGQQRLDVPHLRSMESSIAADFDLLAGKVMAGDKPLVVRGMEIVTSGAIGNPATDLQLVVASSIIMHSLASEHGTIFSVPAGTAAEVLNSTNAKVTGSFTAGQVNYIGLDLRRVADDTTADLVMFMDANTKLETPKNVPLARTLQYKIVISTTDFSSTPNLLPIAKVTTNSTNTVTALEDARNMNFRLGSGGSVPDRYHSFPWTSGRLENTSGSVFTGADKGIASTKEWMDAVMTRLWEVGGGQYWYSATSDRELKLIMGTPVIVATSDNFQWTLGSSNLQWASLSVQFGNSPVAYNTVVDGNTTILDNQCLYVDVDRTSIAALVPHVSDLITLGQSAIPGQRYVIAWRYGNNIFIRERQYELGRTLNVANTVVFGLVKLKYVAGDPANPLVLAMQTNGGFVNTADSANGHAFTGTGNGSGSGFFGTGGTSAGPGIKGQGGAGGLGGIFDGGAGGNAALFTGGSNAGGITINGGSGTGGVALTATATGANKGAIISAGTVGDGLQVTGTGAAGNGITALAAGTGTGIKATGGNGTTGNLGIGGDFVGGGQWAVRAVATAGLFAAHAIFAQGSDTGGSYGAMIKGGDLNASKSGNDATFDVGYGAGLVAVAGQSYGGVGVAGYGGGTTGTWTAGSAAPGGQGGYFVGVASASFNSADGILTRGGLASGTNTPGHGLTSYGGGTGGAGTGGAGVRGIGGNTAGGTGGLGGSFTGGTGTTGGAGISASGGSSGVGGIGVIGNGGGTAGIGVKGTGAGTGPGVMGLGSGSTLTPLTNCGGNFKGTNLAIYAVGDTNGQGAWLKGVGSGKGAEISSTGSALALDLFSDDGNLARTLQSISGYLSVTGTAPASTTGFSNTITRSNICKMWADITVPTTDGACTVNDGFNITSASVGSNAPDRVTISFASSMASANYAVSITNQDLGASSTYYWYVYSKTSTQLVIAGKYWTSAIVDAPMGTGAGTSVRILVTITGAQ